MPDPTERQPRARWLASPYPHLMAFAPLDAWARMLLAPPVWVHPRYWLRLGFALFTSAIGTVLTLPERLVLWPVLRAMAGRSALRLHHPPGAIVVLGYPRSGTTHLHYLLACDPRSFTPRWYQTLAPCGFVLSWAVLRFLLIPFVSNKRLMDDMAFGPEWPAEDEFAVNNWSVASGLPGRLVLPRMHAFYRRFHTLEGLSGPELARWRRTTWAFLWKMSRLARRRMLLLKSPSHTARVRELAAMLGSPGSEWGGAGVRFIHISRDPAPVIRSNLSMLNRARRYHLQGSLPPEDTERSLVAELVATERKYDAESRDLPPGQVAEVRYQDLVADPIGELRRLYTELGLGWTADLEQRLVAYLRTIADYRAAHTNGPRGEGGGPLDADGDGRWLVERFGHDRPAVPNRPLPPLAPPNPEGRIGRGQRGVAAAVSAALACALLWIGLAWFLGTRYDWLSWPVGVVIGMAGVRAARVGSVRLGLVAASLSLLVLMVVAFPATFLSEYYPRPVRDWEWERDVWRSTYRGLLAKHNLFWVLMGMASAYQFASRKHVHPPGRG